MPKSKIIKELVNDEISLEKALYRVFILAKDLKDEKLEQWAKNEIQGYENYEEIPEYRRVKLHFVGNYKLGLTIRKNASLPMLFLEEFSPQEKENFSTHKLNTSVSLFEKHIKTGQKLCIPVLPENMQLFAEGTNAEILAARGEINPLDLPRIQAIIKTKVLDILFELEANFGCLDDMDISDSNNQNKLEVIQKIDNIIVCDTYNTTQIGDENVIEESNFSSEILEQNDKHNSK